MSDSLCLQNEVAFHRIDIVSHTAALLFLASLFLSFLRTHLSRSFLLLPKRISKELIEHYTNIGSLKEVGLNFIAATVAVSPFLLHLTIAQLIKKQYSF